MLRILIAEDHPIIRYGLRQILATAKEPLAVDDAVNSDEVLDKTAKSDYDLLLLDVTMPGKPGKNGFEVLSQLRIKRPELKVLALNMHPEEEEYAMEILRAGACGYLTKDSAPEELLTAVNRVAHGEKYVSPHLAELLLSNLQTKPIQRPHESLSKREYIIMRMIASGKAIAKIADELSLSPKTISTYRSRVLEKMQVSSNAELVRYAVENRLLD